MSTFFFFLARKIFWQKSNLVANIPKWSMTLPCSSQWREGKQYALSRIVFCNDRQVHLSVSHSVQASGTFLITNLSPLNSCLITNAVYPCFCLFVCLFTLCVLPADTVKELVSKCLQARDMAYCPYSRFPVGAAILTADGAIITGNNPTGDFSFFFSFINWELEVQLSFTVCYFILKYSAFFSLTLLIIIYNSKIWRVKQSALH